MAGPRNHIPSPPEGADDIPVQPPVRTAPPAAETEAPRARALADVQPPAKAAAQKQWLVYDRNAKQGRRDHQVGDAVYSLSATEGTPMPQAHALIFLVDSAFRVIDPAGNELAPMPKIDRNEVTGGVILRPGQVVAALTELTDAALSARIARLPGGADAIEEGREAMIELLATYKPRESSAGEKPLEDVDPMDDRAVNDILAKRGSTSQILRSANA